MKNEDKNIRLARLYGYAFALTTLLFFGIYFLVEYLNIYNTVTISFLVVATILFIISAFVCIKFDHEIGCYVCSKCNKKFKPSYNAMLKSAHLGRKMYLRCSNCDEKSWAKKCYEDLNEKEKRN